MANESFALREIERRLAYLETLGLVSVGLHAATHAAAGTDPTVGDAALSRVSISIVH